jgi:hypothetical protein
VKEGRLIWIGTEVSLPLRSDQGRKLLFVWFGPHCAHLTVSHERVQNKQTTETAVPLKYDPSAHLGGSKDPLLLRSVLWKGSKIFFFWLFGKRVKKCR